MRRAWLALALAGCLGSTPEERAAEALGPEVGPTGPRHRPGQPCLVCHGPAYLVGERELALAGTVYERRDDTQGRGGVEVIVTDATGTELRAVSNSAGNFMFEVDERLEAPFDDGGGTTRIPRAPVYPLRVLVREGAREQEMRNVIHREGSCNACHGAAPGAASNGRIYLEDPS